jgi:hypothetical protein
MIALAHISFEIAFLFEFIITGTYWSILKPKFEAEGISDHEMNH